MNVTAPVSLADEEEYLSLEQALEVLGASKPTIYRWLAQGVLKGFKAGKKWRFRRSDLLAFLERRPSMPAIPVDDLDTEIEFVKEELERLGSVLPVSMCGGEDPQAATVGVLAAAYMALAAQSGSSDLHFEPVAQPGRTGMLVRLRSDMVLRDVRVLPGSVGAALLACYEQMGRTDASARTVPQLGRFPFEYLGKDYEFRTAALPSASGQSMVLRLFHRGDLLTGLETLGLEESDAARLRAMSGQPNGVLLVAGPVGSGKTTLLYNLLLPLADETHKVMTLEDPVDHPLARTVQIALNPRGGLNLAEGLRAVLCSDPDVILVGDLREPAALDAVLGAALTGQVVLLGLSAAGAADAIQRLLEIGADTCVLSGTLIGAVGVRLLRKICPACKQSYTAKAEYLARFGLPVPDGRRELTLYRGTGCDQCHRTGYRGRTGLFEVLCVDERIAMAIVRGAASEEIEGIAREAGMSSLREDGVRKALAGITTPDEVMRVAAVGMM